MRYSKIIIIYCFVLLLITASSVFAQPNNTKTRYYLSGGITKITAPDYLKSVYKNGLNLSTSLGLYNNHNPEVLFTFSYQFHKSKFEVLRDMHQFNLDVAPKFNFAKKASSLNPYILFGLGVSYITIDNYYEITDGNFENKYTNESNIYYHFGGGIEVDKFFFKIGMRGLITIMASGSIKEFEVQTNQNQGRFMNFSFGYIF